MSKFLFVILFVLSCSRLFAISKEIDSLIQFLNSQELDDSQRYELTYRIASKCSDADMKIKYSQEAMDMADKLEKDLTYPLIVLGNGYLDKGNLTLALESFLKAAELCKKNNNKIVLATAYDGISNTFSSQENYANAIRYLKKAIDILETTDDARRLASAKLNLGFEYYKAGKYDSALVLFNRSKAAYNKIGFKIGEAYCIGNAGLVYAHKNLLDTAESRLVMAINILEANNQDFAVTDFTLEHAKVLNKKGLTDSSIASAGKS